MLTTLLLLCLPLTDPPSETRPATPAELRIDNALTSIRTRPDDPRAFNELGFAYARRARETADPTYYERGLAAVRTSLALAEDNLGARKTEGWILLGQHRFEDALVLASELHKRTPDDLWIYGLLVDAHIELGNYSAAEGFCQWMLDMRPGNVAGLTRASYLRELFGDTEGALELMGLAYAGTSPAEREDRAWILTHMAHLNRMVGRAGQAVPLLQRALELFPDYHYALGELGKAHALLGETKQAARQFARRYEVAPHPENLFDLALALDRDGRSAEAQTHFEAFEEAALEESTGLDNANRELVRYYADRVPDGAGKALEIAARMRERRRDIHTLFVHAKALFVNGELERAQLEIEAALEVGIREAEMLLLAAEIAAAKGERQAARDYLDASRSLDPRATALLERGLPGLAERSEG